MTAKFYLSEGPLSIVTLIAPFFFWGTAMVAMKETLDHTTPLFLATLRLLPAGFLVLLVGLWRLKLWRLKQGNPTDVLENVIDLADETLAGQERIDRSPTVIQSIGWQGWIWIIAFALVDGTLFQGFLAEGLTHTGAGLGSVMIDSHPLMVALLALWLFEERMGVWGWSGMVVGILGISLLGLPGEWIAGIGYALVTQLHQSSAIALTESTARLNVQLTSASIAISPENLLENLWHHLLQNGQGLMLMAALAMAMGTVISRFVSRHADPIVATGWHMVLGSVPLLLGSWLWETNQWARLTLFDYANLAYSTVFGTAIAYGLFFYFAASGSLTSLSSLTFLTPIFALFFSSLLLNEALSLVQWIGVFLTLVSIYLINQRLS